MYRLVRLVAEHFNTSFEYVAYEMEVHHWYPCVVLSILRDTEKRKQEILYSAAAGFGGIKVNKATGDPEGWIDPLVYEPDEVEKIEMANDAGRSLISQIIKSGKFKPRKGSYEDLIKAGVKKSPEIYEEDGKYYTPELNEKGEKIYDDNGNILLEEYKLPPGFRFITTQNKDNGR